LPELSPPLLPLSEVNFLGSGLAFGGRDLRTAFLGCLLGGRIAYFRAPVMGRPPLHWHYNIRDRDSLFPVIRPSARPRNRRGCG
jgi:hypothetical protein